MGDLSRLHDTHNKDDTGELVLFDIHTGLLQGIEQQNKQLLEVGSLEVAYERIGGLEQYGKEQHCQIIRVDFAVILSRRSCSISRKRLGQVRRMNRKQRDVAMVMCL